MTDKIIFWMTGPDLHFTLSHFLQDKLDADLYSIFDITNKPKFFFQNQKFVNFKKIWFYHDFIKMKGVADLEYLSNFEKKYKINLWQLAINERIFSNFNEFYNFSYDEILIILEQECKLFENILDEVNPDFFVTPLTMLHHHQLFYEMCKSKGVKILMLSLTNIGYNVILSSTPTMIDSADVLDTINPKKMSFEEMQKFVNSYDFSKQVKTYQRKHANKKFDLIRASFQFLFRSNNSNVHTHYTYFGRNKLKVLLSMINSKIKKQTRFNFINKHFETKIVPDEKFIYYPLNMDQERATLLGSPFYTNQIVIIQNIAKSLPIDYTLYVKEHPAQASREWRKISDYIEIMKIPNVKLLHPDVSIKELYQNCKLVIALGGAPGFEASIYGKPVIIFSNTDYMILPSVSKLDNIEELPDVIRNSLSIKVKENDVSKFLILLQKHLINFDWIDFQIKQSNHFYFGGNLVDVDISDSQMQSFLISNKENTSLLVDEHIKKIQEFRKTGI